jgi:hypothetical protein
MIMSELLYLIPLGFVVGIFGTIIGAGGGFVLVPALIFLYPQMSPESITGISITVVFFNALSGSIAYARDKRIDYRSGLYFSAAALPGSILGAIVTGLLSRRIYNGIFGVLLMAISVFLLINPDISAQTPDINKNDHLLRSITDASGVSYSFSYRPVRGILISAAVGFFSNLFGIGGGIIHVPALIRFLSFPVHIATATSHFILAVTSLSGTIVHLSAGSLAGKILQTAALSAGAVGGAQLGARLSGFLRGIWIIRGLAGALALTGVRIFIMSFAG